MTHDKPEEKKDKEIISISPETSELSIDEFSIVELEDRLEFLARCDNRCNIV